MSAAPNPGPPPAAASRAAVRRAFQDTVALPPPVDATVFAQNSFFFQQRRGIVVQHFGQRGLKRWELQPRPFAAVRHARLDPGRRRQQTGQERGCPAKAHRIPRRFPVRLFFSSKTAWSFTGNTPLRWP